MEGSSDMEQSSIEDRDLECFVCNERLDTREVAFFSTARETNDPLSTGLVCCHNACFSCAQSLLKRDKQCAICKATINGIFKSALVARLQQKKVELEGASKAQRSNWIKVFQELKGKKDKEREDEVSQLKDTFRVQMEEKEKLFQKEKEEAMRKQIEENQASIAQLRAELQAVSVTKSQENLRMETENQSLHNQVQTLTERLRHSEVDRLKIETERQEKAKLSQQLSLREEELRSHMSSISLKEEELQQQSRAQLSQKDDLLRHKQEELNALQEELKKLKEEATTVKGKYERAKVFVANLNAEKLQAQKFADELQGEIQKYQVESKTFEFERQEMRKWKSLQQTQEDQISFLRERLTSAIKSEEELKELKLKIRTMQQKKKDEPQLQQKTQSLTDTSQFSSTTQQVPLHHPSPAEEEITFVDEISFAEPSGSSPKLQNASHPPNLASSQVISTNLPHPNPITASASQVFPQTPSSRHSAPSTPSSKGGWGLSSLLTRILPGSSGLALSEFVIIENLEKDLLKAERKKISYFLVRKEIPESILARSQSTSTPGKGRSYSATSTPTSSFISNSLKHFWTESNKPKEFYDNFLDAMVTQKMSIHPYLLKNEGIVKGKDEGREFFLVYPFVKPNLSEWLQEKDLSGGVEEREIRYVFHQLLAGIRLLHSADLVHRNLSSSSILLSDPEAGKIKLASFQGISSLFNKQYLGPQPTLSINFWAPELCYSSKEQHIRIDWKRADMWAAGCILAILLGARTSSNNQETKADLFRSNNTLDLIHEILSIEECCPSSPFHPLSAYFIKQTGKSQSVSRRRLAELVDARFRESQAVDLLRRLLSFEAENRMTAEAALQHPWVAADHNYVSIATWDEKADFSDYALQTWVDQQVY